MSSPGLINAVGEGAGEAGPPCVMVIFGASATLRWSG
jgi:hypothetical protein